MYRDMKWLKHIHHHIDIHVFNSWFGLSFSVVDSVSAQIRGDCFYFIKYFGRFDGFLRSCTNLCVFFFGSIFFCSILSRDRDYSIFILYIWFIRPVFVITLYKLKYTARYLNAWQNITRIWFVRVVFMSLCGIFVHS